MKTPYLFALASLAAAVPAQTGGDKSFFGIFAETRSMRIMGMKPRKMPNLPPGIKLPAAAKAMMSQAPTRSLTVRLWAPMIAPDGATAVLHPPSNLQQGDSMNLDLFRPKPAEPGGGGGTNSPGGSSDSNQDFTIKIYWGSSATVQAGQPKVFSLGTMTMDQKMEMGRRMRGMNPAGLMGGGPGGGVGGNYFYKDGWTTGYWPTESQPGDIPDEATLPGTYTLNTSFAGNVSIDAPSNVDFLAPIELTSPDLGTKPNMAEAISYQWNAIPNALGEFATMMGMEGKNTLILWSSSEVYVEQLMADMGYLQMAEVNNMVNQKVFMPGSSTSATVPAGIFQNCDFAMFNMVGYGPGTAKDDGVPVPRIQTKTTLNVMFPLKRSNRGGPPQGGDGG